MTRSPGPRIEFNLGCPAVDASLPGRRSFWAEYGLLALPSLQFSQSEGWSESVQNT